ncbi:transglutaminase domain-containing protein [Paenibacillus sp. GCM10027626]|uniref:transglutaminase domain-containing protein n=1 Tax=Paenibacillus sp. GCM10027626 TaxID=3273411 RepID=UPI003624FCD8
MYKLLSSLVLSAVLLIFGTGSQLGNPQVAPSEMSSLQALKQKVVSQLQKQIPEIQVDYDGNKTELSEKIADVLKEAIADNDYIAYIVDSYFYTVRTWGASAKIKVNVTYRESAQQTAKVEQMIDRLLPKIVTKKMSDKEKVKAIHDWVVRNLAYDASLSRYTAYEALTEGTAVCQGYSLLVYRMLEKSGIENRIIEGEVDTGSHVWNLVKLDDRWYHVDATWDDPTPDKPGKVSYTYFLKNDQQMKKDHTWTKSYPAAK